MPQSSTGWGASADQIGRGGLAMSTEARLNELRRWKGFTSFMSPGALAAGAGLAVTPLAQVLGCSGGLYVVGALRTTGPRQGRARLGKARWRERSGPIKSWDTVRRRALDRLKRQAELLGADAVIGIRPSRREERDEEGRFLEFEFAGTAVSVGGWRRPAKAPPVLSLASAQELSMLVGAGAEPVGVAGSFASVQSTFSISSSLRGSSWNVAGPNAELPDLTTAVCEARRLALERLRGDARGLGATGLIGIDMHHETHALEGLQGTEVTVHLLATALRGRAAPDFEPKPVIGMGDGDA